ncbi:MAG: hypothetical protein A2X86_02025 [Bdellovibrionales bacterium GWA2_49_15]|nr:MAG: hypothetical protein A2X86_02025 [Bdellovibrionales bacterium GWA2_49_15]
MKLVTLVCVLFVSFAAFSADVVELIGKDASVGLIANKDYAKASKTFSFKRTAKTASKVTVKFDFLFVQPGCVEYAIEYTAIPALKSTNCVARLDLGHDCEEVTFEGYQTAKRVCKRDGTVLNTAHNTLVLNFEKAVVLTATADELFEVNVSQDSMQAGKATLRARPLDTDSVYKVKVSGDEVSFKAE